MTDTAWSDSWRHGGSGHAWTANRAGKYGPVQFSEYKSRTLREAQVRLLIQTFLMRRITIWLAMAVTALLFYIEWRVFTLLTENPSEDRLFVLLAVTPIVAITAITIAALAGVFRGGQKNDTGNLAGLLNRISGEN